MKVPRWLSIGCDVTRPGITHWPGQNPPYPAHPPRFLLSSSPSLSPTLFFPFSAGGEGGGRRAGGSFLSSTLSESSSLTLLPLCRAVPSSFPRGLPNSTSLFRLLPAPQSALSLSKRPLVGVMDLLFPPCQYFSDGKVVGLTPPPRLPSARSRLREPKRGPVPPLRRRPPHFYLRQPDQLSQGQGRHTPASCQLPCRLGGARVLGKGLASPGVAYLAPTPEGGARGPPNSTTSSAVDRGCAQRALAPLAAFKF